MTRRCPPWFVLLTLLAFPVLADEGGAQLAKRLTDEVEKRVGQARERMRREVFQMLDRELVDPPAGSYADAAEALGSMTAAEAYRHVAYLASDALQGRDAGEPGGWKAAEYVAEAFRSYGLAPAGSSFFQEFSLPGRKLAGLPELAVTGVDGSRRAFSMEALEFVPYGFTGSGQVEAPLVFVGYGISAPELRYDDYQGIDVKGKIVLCLRHEPQENDAKSRFAGKENTAHAWFVAKARRAKELGAAGFLLVTDPLNHATHLPLSPGTLGTGEATEGMRKSLAAIRDDTLAKDRIARADLLGFLGQARTTEESVGIPAVHVSLATAQALIDAAGEDAPPLESVQAMIDAEGKPGSFSLRGVKVRLTVNIAADDKRTCNVVAVLEGGARRDEWLVVGAHYDHVGANAQGEVWNGADDNASGTAALMQVARALAASPEPPERSVLFLAFGAEEKGLIGSAHYVEHPLVPLAQTIAMINMDMVGRGDDDLSGMLVLGRETSPELSRALDEANAEVKMHLGKDDGMFENSDHFSFYRKGIPVLFFNSGLHQDYHQPTDEVGTIHPGKIRRTAQLVYRLAYRIGSLGERPHFVKLPDTGRGRPRLGVVPRAISPERARELGLAEGRTGLELTEVMPDFPAEKAGLKAGDVVVEVGGEGIPAENPMGALLARLAAHPAGKPLRVKLRRGGEWIEKDVAIP